MRVLVAHSRHRLPGGEERSVELLCSALAERGVDVRLFEPSAAELDSWLRRLRAGAGMVYRPSAGRAIRTRTAGWRPDVVHVHNLLPMLSPSVLRTSKRLGAAVVLTTHNYRLVCPSGTLTRRGRTHTDCIHGSSFLCGVRGARRPYRESILYGAAIELHRRLGLVDRWVDRYVAPSTTSRMSSPGQGRFATPPLGSQSCLTGFRCLNRQSEAATMPCTPVAFRMKKASRRSSMPPRSSQKDTAAWWWRRVRFEQMSKPRPRMSGTWEHWGGGNWTTSVGGDIAIRPSECPEVQPYRQSSRWPPESRSSPHVLAGLEDLACDGDSVLVEPGDASD